MVLWKVQLCLAICATAPLLTIAICADQAEIVPGISLAGAQRRQGRLAENGPVAHYVPRAADEEAIDKANLVRLRTAQDYDRLRNRESAAA